MIVGCFLCAVIHQHRVVELNNVSFHFHISLFVYGIYGIWEFSGDNLGGIR